MNIKMKQSYQMKSGRWKIWASQKCVPYNTQTKRPAMLKRKVGLYRIQKTQRIKQKKRNRIEILTPVEVLIS